MKHNLFWTLRYCLLILAILLLYTADLYSQDIPYGFDTVDIYSDGFDIIYVLDQDSTEAVSRLGSYESKGLNPMDITAPIYTINVTLSNKTESLNLGLQGINTTGMFDQSSLPEEDSTKKQWQALIDLKPEVLRFPSGSNSKFMHLLSDRGYGYNLEEMIRYYDITDDIINAPPYDSILLHLNDVAYLDDFMDDGYVQQFLTLKDKWVLQNQLDSGNLYINSFLRLIKQIDSSNAGHHVKVLLCLNIFSEPADTCRKIVEYLRDNDIYNVEVAGVEMGNETYAKIYQDMLGFDGFDSYYDFISGVNISDKVDSLFQGSPMDGDHDYLSTFKGDTSFHCKVGLVGEPITDKSYAFSLTSGGGGYGEPLTATADTTWNIDLRAHFNDHIVAMPGAVSTPSFDAVILHTYYDSHSYDSLAYKYIDSVYLCDETDALLTNDTWYYDHMDVRLDTAFDSIRINFRNFIRLRYKESIDKFNEVFDFSMAPSDSTKLLWTSEININDSNKGYDPGIQKVVSAFSNNFYHCVLFQEWWLQNAKINLDSTYLLDKNFYTIATWQNFVGGTDIDLMSPADDREILYYDKHHTPFSIPETNPDHRNFQVKRATYYTMQLLGVITSNDLKMMKSKYTTYSRNINTQPTTFISPDKQYFYLVYTNWRDTIQKYTVNAAPLRTGPSALFPGASSVTLDTATLFYISAEQPYATAGQSTIFDINECYVDSTFYPINIAGIDTLKDNDLVLTVPPYSAGYIKAKFIVKYPHQRYAGFIDPEAVSLFPNPTADYFTLAGQLPDDNLSITIVSMSGAICKVTQCKLGERVLVEDLPSGLYTVVISSGNGEKMAKLLAKIH